MPQVTAINHLIFGVHLLGSNQFSHIFNSHCDLCEIVSPGQSENVPASMELITDANFTDEFLQFNSYLILVTLF